MASLVSSEAKMRYKTGSGRSTVSLFKALHESIVREIKFARRWPMWQSKLSSELVGSLVACNTNAFTLAQHRGHKISADDTHLRLNANS